MKRQNRRPLKLVNNLDTKYKISSNPLLNKYEHLFDHLLGEWKTDPLDLRLKSGEIYFQLSPFPIPKIHEETLEKEINRLCHVGISKPQVLSEYQSHSLSSLRNTVLSL
jgi:hypothetical protein